MKAKEANSKVCLEALTAESSISFLLAVGRIHIAKKRSSLAVKDRSVSGAIDIKNASHISK